MTLTRDAGEEGRSVHVRECEMANQASRGGSRWRIIGWGGAVGLLLLPFVAMRFDTGFDWDETDFIVAGALFGSVGLGIELAVRKSGSLAYRGGAAVALLAALLLVWVNLAVGFLGSEDNPANLMFLGVIAVALVGGIVAGFRAAGMARALLATALAQALVGVGALAAGLASPGSSGLYEVAMGTTLFGGLWLLSAALFARAARQPPTVGARP
jgi:hypothetical protein